jgi:hypothetical protein
VRVEAISITGGLIVKEDKLVVLSPAGDAQTETYKTSERVETLNGKTVGLYWNGKPNGDVFLDEIAHHLKTRFDGLSVVKLWEVKPDTRTVYGNSAESLKFMAKAADFLIGSSAD